LGRGGNSFLPDGCPAFPLRSGPKRLGVGLQVSAQKPRSGKKRQHSGQHHGAKYRFTVIARDLSIASEGHAAGSWKKKKGEQNLIQKRRSCASSRECYQKSSEAITKAVAFSGGIFRPVLSGEKRSGVFEVCPGAGCWCQGGPNTGPGNSLRDGGTGLTDTGGGSLDRPARVGPALLQSGGRSSNNSRTGDNGSGQTVLGSNSHCSGMRRLRIGDSNG